MENKGVILVISAESIYLHSIATFSFSSNEEFEIKLPPSLEIIQLKKGNKKNSSTSIHSQSGETGKCEIEVTVIGFFEEKKVIKDNGELGNHYGMRFYPFISSLIKGEIICSKKVGSVSILIPDRYRFLFHLSSIIQNQEKSLLRQSFGREISQYVFTWKNVAARNKQYKLDINIPVRLGGRSLLRIVYFPIYYWIGVLVGIALLSFTKQSSVLIGSITAAWLFMLQRWDSSSLPQNETILTKFYLLFGFILGLWGLFWGLFGIKALFLAIPIVVLLYYVFKATHQFNETGELPTLFATWYAKRVIKKDQERERRSTEVQSKSGTDKNS